MASQTILITGTNSGFGRLTALALARAGHRVFAAMRDSQGRNAEAAKMLAAEGAGQITIVELDVTSDASVNQAMKTVLAGPLDVLVNNAGSFTAGLMETVTPEDLKQQYEVNVFGLQRVTCAVLPNMHQRKKGLLIHLSSGLGRLVMPLMGAYISSKHAVEALGDAYRMELAPFGIESVLVQPGAFPTELNSKIAMGSDMSRAAAYGDMVAKGMQQQQAFMQGLFSQPNGPKPQEVADAVLKLVEAPAGSRPARVVVDRFMGGMVETLNKAHADIAAAMAGPQK
jgi:NAD(P)-dependent dehydrogenase (short-subunit alcohol dehydrogenase family)